MLPFESLDLKYTKNKKARKGNKDRATVLFFMNKREIHKLMPLCIYK